MRIVGVKSFIKYFSDYSLDFEFFYELLRLLIDNIDHEECKDFEEILKFLLQNKKNRLNIKMIQKKERRVLKSKMEQQNYEFYQVYSKYLD